MNYSTNDNQEDDLQQIEASTLPPAEGSVDSAVFPGDSGSIPHETRRVLVQLLLGPAVDGRRQANLWGALLRDETILRERLHELFLELVIDHDQKVAFTRQVVADDIDIPILLRRAHLNFLESALILLLRQRLTQAEAQGDRAVVSLVELLEHLSVYERTGNVDHARFDKQRHGAIEKAKTLNFLQKLRGAEDRFEVSPTLKLLFPAEEIQALTRTYLSMQNQGDSEEITDSSTSSSASRNQEDDNE